MTPTDEPRRAAVVGTGLIGGSIGLALRARGWWVTGRDADPTVAARARALGALDVVGEDPDAEVTFVATPLGAVVDDGSLVQASWGAPVAKLRGAIKAQTVKAGGASIHIAPDPLSFTIQTTAGETIQKMSVDKETALVTFQTGSTPLLGLGEDTNVLQRLVDGALARNPSHAFGWFWSGWIPALTISASWRARARSQGSAGRSGGSGRRSSRNSRMAIDCVKRWTCPSSTTSRMGTCSMGFICRYASACCSPPSRTRCTGA